MFPEISYNATTGQLEWAVVQEAIEYQIDWDEIEGNVWKVLYTGTSNSCDYNLQGEKKVRGRNKVEKTTGPEWEKFGVTQIISVP